MRPGPARWVFPCVGVVLACVGLLAGRADVALLGVPLVLIALWPARTEPVSVTLGEDRLVIGQPNGADAVRLRFTCDGHRPVNLLVGGRREVVGVRLRCVRTGPQPLLSVDWDAHGPFLLAHTAAASLLGEPRVVLPSYLPLGLVPESRRLRGLTGPATSQRAGDGFELRDVHPMGPGDSFRRIDWRTTARQPGDAMWVRGFFATGEAIAWLVVDSRDEVGSDLHTWNSSVPLRVDEPTSLDLARHAAASGRTVAPATGRRHLDRLTYALALSAPVGTPTRRVRPPQVPADAIVYLFSTLLDDEPVALVRAFKAAGHEVLVVDTLPAVRPVAEVSLEVAWRVLSAERAARIQRLEAEHVPVIRWAGAARAVAGQRFAAIQRAWSRQRARR